MGNNFSDLEHDNVSNSNIYDIIWGSSGNFFNGAINLRFISSEPWLNFFTVILGLSWFISTHFRGSPSFEFGIVIKSFSVNKVHFTIDSHVFLFFFIFEWKSFICVFNTFPILNFGILSKDSMFLFDMIDKLIRTLSWKSHLGLSVYNFEPPSSNCSVM